jgi:cytochrome c5
VNNKLNAAERKHLQRVKSLPCSVCNAPPPSAAHHINQGQQYTTVALCYDCHQGSLMGFHGQKRAWAIRKMDELDALNVTIQRLLTDGMALEENNSPF